MIESHGVDAYVECEGEDQDPSARGAYGLDPLLGAITDANDPRVMMRRVLDAALALIAAADGAVIELVVDGQLGYVCAAGTLAPHVGLIVPLCDSLSGLAFSTRRALWCADSSRDERVNARACAQTGIASMVCVPLARGPEMIGVLKVTSRQAGAFDGADAAMLEPMGEFIAAVIAAAGEIVLAAGHLAGGDRATAPGAGHHSPQPSDQDDESPRRSAGRFVADVLWPGMAREVAKKQEIEQVLADRSIQMVCQPIVALATGSLLGVEALARFPKDAPARAPDRWFAAAAAVGLGVELELLAVETAAGLLGELPEGVALTINVSAAAIADPRLLGLLAGRAPDRIVLELTEHVPVEDYPRLRDQLHQIRRQGVRLAIDDTGAGFASLEHIVHLAPDLIKLDRVFARSIDSDPARRAVAHAMLDLAGEIGAQVIAEGIETAAELDTVRALGIPYGQGYLLSRPQAPHVIPQRFPAALGDVADGRDRTAPQPADGRPRRRTRRDTADSQPVTVAAAAGRTAGTRRAA